MTNTNTLLADLTDYQNIATESARQLEHALTDRNHMILTAHQAGLTITDIAAHIGVSRQTVHKSIRQAREQLVST
jgi:DNA-binding NarL/FixJ family response regulator